MVACQAHNLEVVGSSPTPTPILVEVGTCSVMVNMPLCPRGDSGSDSRQVRQFVS